MNEVTKDTLLIGDQHTLRFRTKLAAGEKFIFPAPVNPLIPGLEIVGEPKTDTIVKGKDFNELESLITVTSFDSGSYSIPAFTAYRIKSDGSTDTLSFDGGKLEFTTIQIDTASFKPFDVKDQMNYPYSVREALPWLGLLFLLVLAGYLVGKAIKNIREKRTLFGKPIVVDPPHIVALRTLEKLRNEKLWLTNQKEYYTRVTDTLRGYIESRYTISAMEQTSGEILKDLAKVKMEPKVYKELSDLLNLSDLVKFAKYTAPEQECESAIPSAVRFVNATFLDQIEQSAESDVAQAVGKTKSIKDGGV
ncbi:MAG: hypothetical protein Q8R90_07480 [Bacteroidales bacterium]|jgi:hypothetical protein|nr:hypothetical protein [Bacteroidales bacterium]